MHQSDHFSLSLFYCQHNTPRRLFLSALLKATEQILDHSFNIAAISVGVWQYYYPDPDSDMFTAIFLLNRTSASQQVSHISLRISYTWNRIII